MTDLYSTRSARELRKEERQLMSILRKGCLLKSEVAVMVDPAAIQQRLQAVRAKRFIGLVANHPSLAMTGETR